MNLKEFFDKNPGLLTQFKKCTNKDDFMSVAQENNIRFGAGKLDEVYAYVLSASGKNDSSEIDDDALSMASGGAREGIPTSEIGNNTSIAELELGGTSVTLIQ